MRKKKKMGWKSDNNIIVVILSVIAIVISIAAIAIALPRAVGANSTYYGATISILSLIVTLLIGWNIYSAIEIKKDVKKLHYEFEEHGSMIDNLIDNTRIGVLMTRGQIEEEFFYFCINGTSPSYNMISHIIKAVNCWMEVKDYNRANNCVDGLLHFVYEFMKGPSKIHVTTKDREKLFELTKGIPEQQRLGNIQKVYTLISELGEADYLFEQERITKMAIRQSMSHKGDGKLYNEAMRTLGNNLDIIKKVVRQNTKIDKDTEKRINDLASILVNSTFVSAEYQHKLKLLISAVRNNENEKEVEEYLREMVSVMEGNYLREMYLSAQAEQKGNES